MSACAIIAGHGTPPGISAPLRRPLEFILVSGGALARRYHTGAAVMTRKDSPRERGPRHIRLLEYMLDSKAWQSLDPVARALYVEITRRYRGPNSNNGKIPYSVRKAATALNVSRQTESSALLHL
jgi:hypothetical protein